MSQEQTDISKIGKLIYPQRFLPRWWKKIGKLQSTKNKVGHVSLDPRKSIFSENHIWAPRGYCCLKFLHPLENDQGLLAYTPQGTDGGPSTFFNNKHSKISLQFSVYNFVARGSNLIKIIHLTCREAGITIWVQIVWGPAPLKCGRAKNVQNSARFWQLQSLIANISGTEERIKNRKASDQQQSHPR